MTTRKNIMLGTAGHVDHGKTALVKLLTGCDTDRLAEEKARGLTIELGFAPCRMADDRICGVVDVPGHVDFIRNMVAGAQGIDVVIFVVAADDGVMPQTREHLDILTLMGVRHGLVALTKIDLVGPEMRELAADDVRRAVQGTFLAAAPICPVSNVTGEGYEQFFADLNAVADRCEGREASGLFRLWIERRFPIHGVGTVVSGIPSRGEIRVGDRLRVLPGEQVARVRRLEVYGQDADLGRAGECLALNLAEVDGEQLSRGMVLCADPAARPVRMFEADLTLLPALPQPLKDYAEVHLHVGTAEAMAHVAFLEDCPTAPGGHGLVQMRTDAPLAVAPGERFVIRGTLAGLAGGRLTTLGGGRVLDVSDTRLRRRRAWTLHALDARRNALDSLRDWCAVVLKEAAGVISPADLARRAALPERQAQQLAAELTGQGVGIDAGGGLLVHQDVLTAAERKLVEALERFHAANPARLGIDRAELAATVEIDRAVFELALTRLTGQGRIERRGAVLALAGRGPALRDEDEALAEKIEAALRAGGVSPPDAAELSASTGAPARRVEAALRMLIDRGRAIRLDERLILHADAVAAGQAVVLELFRSAGAFTTMDFRDALGVSRKFAVPLLDHFDTIRLTVRSGNRRTPGAQAKRLLAGPGEGADA